MKILFFIFVLPWVIFGATLAIAAYTEADRLTYFKRVSSAISRLFNTVVTGNELETFSARIGRWQEKGLFKGRVMVTLLEPIFSKGHFKRSRDIFLNQ